MKTVENGAAFLDEVEPGWEQRIDLDTLDLLSGCDCVLGQLNRATGVHRHDRFSNKLIRLGLNTTQAARLGFMLYGSGRPRNLTQAWVNLISRRLAE